MVYFIKSVKYVDDDAQRKTILAIRYFTDEDEDEIKMCSKNEMIKMLSDGDEAYTIVPGYAVGDYVYVINDDYLTVDKTITNQDDLGEVERF